MAPSASPPLAIAGGGLVWLVIFALAAALLQRRRRPTRSDAAHRAAGQRGEDLVTRLLQRVLGPEHVLATDVRTHAPGRTAQLDHLIVGPQGVILLEVKFWRGAIARSSSGTWERRSLARGHARYGSPESQAAYHADVVRLVLRRAGLGRLPVWSAVVLAHPRSRFSETQGAIPVLALHELGPWISGLPALPVPPDAGLRGRVIAALDTGYGTAQRRVPWE